MNITIIKEDNVVVIDGEALNFTLDLERHYYLGRCYQRN